MAKLYVVATPIGNLEDITLRALKILKDVDIILCEDTRVTKRLLKHYKIKTPLLSYHQHSKIKRINLILQFLKEGKNLALVCDAGTPGISDPGNKLIERVIKEFGDKVKIIPIPGASAITAIASLAHFSMQKILFVGFLPKKKQNKILNEIALSPYPVIIFESPHRIIKTLEKLYVLNPKIEVVVAKELTKYFEEVFRGNIKEVIEALKQSKIKGEFTLITKGTVPKKRELGGLEK